MMRHFGVLYQSGALWSSLTLAENITLPLEQYTDAQSEPESRTGVVEARAGRSGWL